MGWGSLKRDMVEITEVVSTVQDWAAWGPGLETEWIWRLWSRGDLDLPQSTDVRPDVRFVKAMLRRKLSLETRMAFRVLENCISQKHLPDSYVFCSRYGEFSRTLGILEGIASDEPVSALAFSLSVHNTASSLFSIHRAEAGIDPFPPRAISLTGAQATLEAAFTEAWMQLNTGVARTVALTYFDIPLPEMYNNSSTTVDNPIAISMVLRHRNDRGVGTVIRLTQDQHRKEIDGGENLPGKSLDLIRVLAGDKRSISIETDIHRWVWNRES